jgi:YidC/Oxa1 family membrane protein insertase
MFLFRVFKNHGLSVIGVSFAVSVFTLPLYFEAEKWQQAERAIREKLAGKAAKIKAIFKGDERYMVLSAFYRQNHYHPVYSLRSSIGLLLQIPFFMAAYSYLSKLDTLMGTPFFVIANLGASDGLLKIGIKHGVTLAVNILPIIMTIVNFAASIIYLKGLNVSADSGKEKIQLFGIAVVFLVLLYNSPSALVLYWTFNNVFSLIKNILQKTRRARRVIFWTVCLCGVLFAVFVLFFHHGTFYKRFLVVLVELFAFCFYFIIRRFKGVIRKLNAGIENKDRAITQARTIVLSSFLLFLLAGIVIPSSLVASSVEEFSFIEQYASPLPFILHTAEQAFGFFVFWVLCVYFLLRGNRRYLLTAFITVISIFGLINTFAFIGNYGNITIEMKFAIGNILIPSLIPLLANIFILLASFAVTIYLLLCRRKQILQFCQIIILIALFTAGIYRTAEIYREFRIIKNQRNIELDSFAELSNSGINNTEAYAPVYEFSKNGKNVLIIMLDSAISGFVPYIFNEKPELTNQFSGFTFFPNTISFGSHTIYGAPALFGGYEYAPAEINARPDKTLASKYNESFLVLPKIFLENNYKVTITDPPLYGDSIQNVFSSFPDINTAKIMNKYTEDWLNRHPDVQLISISNLLNNRLIYFSFMKCAPLIFRHIIYDDGHWLAAENGNTPLDTIDNYSMLDILPKITSFTDNGYNTLTLMVNDLSHSPGVFLNAPDYTIPSVSSINKGNSHFALDKDYHKNIASFLLLGKWFAYLKENGIYNNTRIIVVSDHGNGNSGIKNNILLPTGDSLQSYAALLLFKDFEMGGGMIIDNQFMVNADTPILAVKDIIPNPVNPFTQKPLESKKDDGVTITSSQNFLKTQYENRYNIAPAEWLHVKDSVFDPKNWKKVRVE